MDTLNDDLPPILRCVFCAEPLLVMGDGSYVHDYAIIGIKLMQVPKGQRRPAARRLAERCAALDTTKSGKMMWSLNTPPREGLVWNPTSHHWVRPKALEAVNQFGGVAGSQDEDLPSNQMNAVNSAMLFYYADEMSKDDNLTWMGARDGK